MSNYVFVLDTNKQPLAPCHPARARELLNKGKAAVFRRQPFTIILNYTPEGPIRKEFTLKVDPGSKTTGMAVVSHDLRGDRCIFGLNLQHRGYRISEDLTKRRGVRRNRRSKLRYRQPRFLNRTRPKGWLAPSVLHRFQTSRTWTDRFLRYIPITHSKIEEVKFDTQRMKNPEISGKEYQQGPLFRTEMRHYLLQVYRHTCQYCHGLSGCKILEREHIQPRSEGGSDALYNATLSCRSCNLEKGNYSLKKWLKECQSRKGKVWKARVKGIQGVLKRKSHPPLKDTAVMNAIRHRLFDYHEALGLQPTLHPGWTTARNRLDQGYRKDHWIDAACVGPVGTKVYIPPTMDCLNAKAMGWGTRQMCRVDKFGFPRTGSKGPSTVFGFCTGDLVRAVVPKGKYTGTHVGRVVVRTSGHFTLGGVNTNYRNVTKLQSGDGYNYSYGTEVNEVVVLAEGQTVGDLRKRKMKISKVLTKDNLNVLQVTHRPF